MLAGDATLSLAFDLFASIATLLLQVCISLFPDKRFEFQSIRANYGANVGSEGHAQSKNS